MRDTTPGGARHVANRSEIRLRETDRSARRTSWHTPRQCDHEDTVVKILHVNSGQKWL